MYQRLVKIHPETKCYLEIDPFRLKREATELKSFLENEFDRSDDQYKIFDNIMPLVNAALDGSLDLPFDKWPLRYVSTEGLLPRSFTKLFAKFKCTASGTPLERLTITLIDGEAFALMDFEELGDYPHNVKYP